MATATTMTPSLYYVLMARTCFQRSAATSDQAHSYALNQIGQSYLSKAERDSESAR